MALVSFAKRLSDLAAADPDFPAVTCGGRTLSRGELERLGNRMARDLQSRGVGVGDMVTVALPNSVDWFVAYVGCWKIGAMPQPVSAKLPARELAGDRRARRVEGRHRGRARQRSPNAVCLPVGYESPDALDDGPLPDAMSPAWKAPTSGGSTGRPKLIVSGDPSLVDDEAPPPLGFERDGCLVMPGPLYHNGPHRLVVPVAARGAATSCVLPRFDAEATLAAIEEHRGRRRLPRAHDDEAHLAAARRRAAELRPLVAAGRCGTSPSRARRGSRRRGSTGSAPSGSSSSTRAPRARRPRSSPGPSGSSTAGRSAGRAAATIMITRRRRQRAAGRRDGRGVAAARAATRPRTATSAPKPRTLDGGWESLGDMGWLDDDGYLYLGDRMQDMILTGGANMYPAEVEAAIQEHPAVRSCAVIGLARRGQGQPRPRDRRSRSRHARRAGAAWSSSAERLATLQAAAHGRVRRRAPARRRRQGAARRAPQGASPRLIGRRNAPPGCLQHRLSSGASRSRPKRSGGRRRGISACRTPGAAPPPRCDWAHRDRRDRSGEQRDGSMRRDRCPCRCPDPRARARGLRSRGCLPHPERMASLRAHRPRCRTA